MLHDYLAVWNVLNWIDKDTFLEITEFYDDYYGTEKWLEYQKDYTWALKSYDSTIQLRFNDYIKSQL